MGRLDRSAGLEKTSASCMMTTNECTAWSSSLLWLPMAWSPICLVLYVSSCIHCTYRYILISFHHAIENAKCKWYLGYVLTASECASGEDGKRNAFLGEKGTRFELSVYVHNFLWVVKVLYFYFCGQWRADRWENSFVDPNSPFNSSTWQLSHCNWLSFHSQNKVSFFNFSPSSMWTNLV